MSPESTASWKDDRPGTSERYSAIVHAMHVVLWLLAVAVFAQAVLAGLFLDGSDSWRDWQAINGMLVLPLLALAQVVMVVLVWRGGHGPGWLTVVSVGLLVALLVQNVMGMTSQVAVHVPLGLAIFGLVATLLVRARTLTGTATHPAP